MLNKETVLRNNVFLLYCSILKITSFSLSFYIQQHYLKQHSNFNFPSMFGKHRQLRPFFHQRHWSHFDEPWWDYPMFPRMSMYDHPLNSGIETSVIPHDTQNVAGFSEVVNNENEFKVSITIMTALKYLAVFKF